MIAYLRNDLWAKPLIEKAEQRNLTVDKDAKIKVLTRLTFGAAAFVATAEVVVKIVPLMILGVGHLISTVVNRFAPNVQICRKITAMFYRNSNIVKGASLCALVALGSTVSPSLSRKAKAHFLMQGVATYEEYRDRCLKNLSQQAEFVAQHRKAGVEPQTIYTLNDGKQQVAYLDLLTKQRMAKAAAFVQQAELEAMSNVSASQKKESQRELVIQLDEYMSKQLRKCVELPMTYLEVADEKLKRAQKLKTKGLQFVDEQLQRAGGKEQQLSPKKFDLAAFDKKAKDYRAGVEQQFDQEYAKLEKQVTAFKDAWKQKVLPLEQQQQAAMAQLQQLPAALGIPQASLQQIQQLLVQRMEQIQQALEGKSQPELKLTDDQKAKLSQESEQLEQILTQIQQTVAVAQQSHTQRMNEMAKLTRGSAFKNVEWQAVSYENHFKRVVEGFGKIEAVAKPGYLQRACRFVKGVTPNVLFQPLERYLDPDVA